MEIHNKAMKILCIYKILKIKLRSLILGMLSLKCSIRTLFVVFCLTCLSSCAYIKNTAAQTKALKSCSLELVSVNKYLTTKEATHLINYNIDIQLDALKTRRNY